MITGKDIKNLRESHNLTQEQLGRAIFVEESTICNYEAGRRALKVDTVEAIANVFGYTVDFSLVKKENTSKDEDFYKAKSYDEIVNMTNEDLTDYIFIAQDIEVIANICNVQKVVVDSLELSTLKDLLKNTISNSSRDVIYFKLNKLHEGMEVDVAMLVEESLEYLKLEQEIPREIAEKVWFIDFDLYGDIYRDELLSDNARLLDKDGNDLNVDHDLIFNSEFNPIIYNAQSMDVISYIRDNPVIQIRY